ncbi:hypothetical protein WK36_27020 [Burkholderia cepacia]|nr:hypothetical protein WK36_27020 [Burkholderia cepacia]
MASHDAARRALKPAAMRAVRAQPSSCRLRSRYGEGDDGAASIGYGGRAKFPGDAAAGPRCARGMRHGRVAVPTRIRRAVTFDRV